jgi:hypothetical protein
LLGLENTRNELRLLTTRVIGNAEFYKNWFKRPFEADGSRTLVLTLMRTFTDEA